MNRFLAFLRRDLLIEFSYPWAFLTQVASLLGQVILWFSAAGLIAGRPLAGIESEFFPWVLIGSAGAMFFAASTSSFANRLRREQFAGTLEVLFTSRTPFSRVILYSAAFDLLRALPQIIALLVLAWWQGGRGATTWQHLALFPPLAFCGAAVFASLGVLAAAAVLAWQRGDPAVRLISGAATLFGTAYIPAQALPGALSWIPQLVPLTPFLEGLRGSLLATVPASRLIQPLLLVGLEAALLLPISLFVFHRALVRARRDGSLSRY